MSVLIARSERRYVKWKNTRKKETAEITWLNELLPLFGSSSQSCESDPSQTSMSELEVQSESDSLLLVLKHVVTVLALASHSASCQVSQS